MEHRRIVVLLAVFIMLAAGAAAVTGIVSSGGPGPYRHTSVRGREVEIYGRGVYRHMSAEVAVQGIAQDYVTLFLAVPLLGIGLAATRRESAAASLFLAGVLAYFLVTYLFYLTMGAYTVLFLVYAALLGCSFFALVLTLIDLDLDQLALALHPDTPARFAGAVLFINAVNVALLWLSVVLPPLLDGTIYPVSLEHYTTLIVQGLDLGLLLPLAAVSGVLLWRRTGWGILCGTVYLVFLSLLMLALVAKVIAIGLVGGEIIPVVFIMPATALVTIICAVMMLRGMTVRQS